MAWPEGDAALKNLNILFSSRYAGFRRGIENLQIEHCSSEVSDYLTVPMGGVFIPHKTSDLELEVILLQEDRELYKLKASSRNAVSIVTLSSELQSELEREINVERNRRLI